MSTLTLDEQLIFDVAVALKKVKIPGFRKGVVEEGRFEIAKTIVEYLRSNRWVFSTSTSVLGTLHVPQRREAR